MYRLHPPPGYRNPVEEPPDPASGLECDSLEVTATDRSTVKPATTVQRDTAVALSTTDAGQGGPPVSVEVFGPMRVRWHSGTGTVDITARLTPRGRELLALLVLRPEGMTREALVADLWGEQSPRRPANVVNTALARLTAALGAATDHAVSRIVTGDPLRYLLDPEVFTTDFQRFAAGVLQRRHARTDTDRYAACHHIVDTAARESSQQICPRHGRHPFGKRPAATRSPQSEHWPPLPSSTIHAALWTYSKQLSITTRSTNCCGATSCACTLASASTQPSNAP
ncbi:hypothetical protein GCM10011588_39250 [Nocardia jinanensis]|uniref:OmpR/PhoB-type domain-containing protein n=1 Tax=Nocardia jinanensis TaxID=382504 RepID=A0A917RSG5_9NOCA|nr:hypothetical protein GCM10011588_39250 [Nocardia jinanensis]